MFKIKTKIRTSLLLVIVLMATPSVAQIPQIDQELDRTASHLANLLSDPDARLFVLMSLEASGHHEKKIRLEETFNKGYVKHRDTHGIPISPHAIEPMIEMIHTTKQEMKNAGIISRKRFLNVYFPVDAHRDTWLGGENILVAFAPTGDEADLQKITAYDIWGKAYDLDPNTPPEIPTLVIGIEERSPYEVDVPIFFVAEELETETDLTGKLYEKSNTTSCGGGQGEIGINKIKLLESSDSWPWGDPELYVLVAQANASTPEPERSNLWNWVENENVWYQIGSAANYPTYYQFDGQYDDETYYHFWEEDVGFDTTLTATVGGIEVQWSHNDADDDLGSKYVSKDSVPEFGLKLFSTGSVEFKVDKDCY